MRTHKYSSLLLFFGVVLSTLDCTGRISEDKGENGLYYTYGGLWGSQGEGFGQFDCPYDLAVAPDGTVYVVDCDAHILQHFNSTGSYLGQWLVEGVVISPESDASRGVLFNDPFWPTGVGISPNGNVFVADNWSRNIIAYTPNGSLLNKTAGIPEDFFVNSPPRDVAVAPNGNLYISGGCSDDVCYFSTGGSFLGSWRMPTVRVYRNPFEYRCKNRVTVAPDGDVYVTDFDNYCVRRFTGNGSFLAEWGSRGYGDGQFFEPRDVAVGKNGFVYVVDGVKCNVQYFTPNGSFVGKFGRSGRGKGYLLSPYAVSVAPDLTVYVADAGNYRIQYFRPVSPPK